MSKLQFNPNNHSYTIDGKRLTGVTTILGVIAKPALINWASNMAVDYIQKELAERMKKDRIKGLDADERVSGFLNATSDIFDQARKAYAQKRDKAGDIGTIAHERIEQWIKGVEYSTEMSEQVGKMVNNFTNWATENKVKFSASEIRIFSEKFWFAGTADMICQMGGKTYLGDIKTSSGIYPEMWAQCAAYRICHEEMYPDIKIDGSLIVNLTKDGKINVKTNDDFVGYKKMFLSALVIYRQLNVWI